MTETVLDAYELLALGDEHTRHRVTRDVAHVLDTLELAGLVRQADGTDDDDDVDTVFAELQAWRATRAPADAAREPADGRVSWTTRR